MEVRKHRAPKGALRRVEEGLRDLLGLLTVRKHRAPKGALRQVRRHLTDVLIGSESTERQKVH